MVSVISGRCYHVPVSPGQGVCTCLDALMWARLTIEGLCRRVAELETQAQRHEPRLIVPGGHL